MYGSSGPSLKERAAQFLNEHTDPAIGSDFEKAVRGGFTPVVQGSISSIMDYAAAELALVAGRRAGKSSALQEMNDFLEGIRVGLPEHVLWMCDRCGSFVRRKEKPPPHPVTRQRLVPARFSSIPVNVSAYGVPDCDREAVRSIMES